MCKCNAVPNNVQGMHWQVPSVVAMCKKEGYPIQRVPNELNPMLQAPTCTNDKHAEMLT